MLEMLQSIDVVILQVFNQTLTHPWLDVFFAFVTNLHKQWVFKYLFFPVLLIFWIYRYRISGVKLVLMLAVVVGVTDNLNYRVIKPTFNRTRPNLDPEVHSVLRLSFHPRGASFPSNHSMNTFALMTVLAWVFSAYRWWFFLYAGVVAFSRLYLGVHYLTDVIVGGLLGYLLATLMIRFLFSKWCSPEVFRSLRT